MDLNDLRCHALSTNDYPTRYRALIQVRVMRPFGLPKPGRSQAYASDWVQVWESTVTWAQPRGARRAAQALVARLTPWLQPTFLNHTPTNPKQGDPTL